MTSQPGGYVLAEIDVERLAFLLDVDEARLKAALVMLASQPRVTLRRLDRIFDLRAGEMWAALRWALIDRDNEGAI